MKNRTFSRHLLALMLLFVALTTAIAQQPVIVMNPVGLKNHTTVYVIFDGTQPVAITNFDYLINSQLSLSRSTQTDVIIGILNDIYSRQSDSSTHNVTAYQGDAPWVVMSTITNLSEITDALFAVSRSTDISALIAEIHDHYYNPAATTTIVNAFIPFNPASTMSFVNTHIDVTGSEVYVATITVNELGTLFKQGQLIGNTTFAVEGKIYIDTISFNNTHIDVSNSKVFVDSISVNNITECNTKDIAITSGSITVNNIDAANTKDVVITSGNVTADNIDKCNTKDVVITSGTMNVTGTVALVTSSVTITNPSVTEFDTSSSTFDTCTANEDNGTTNYYPNFQVKQIHIMSEGGYNTVTCAPGGTLRDCPDGAGLSITLPRAINKPHLSWTLLHGTTLHITVVGGW
jgi:hypothetical protein